MSADPQIDLMAAARSGAHQLGAQIADLTIELAAQRALVREYAERLAQLEQVADAADDEKGEDAP